MKLEHKSLFALGRPVKTHLLLDHLIYEELFLFSVFYLQFLFVEESWDDLDVALKRKPEEGK